MIAGKKILVTGGLGYIGSHTALALLAQDAEVIIIDNLSNTRHEVLDTIQQLSGKTVSYYNIDLCDIKNTEAVFNKHQINACIHFAAFKSVGDSVSDPLTYYKNNLYSLINLLELYKKYDYDNLIFSSSCSVYGDADELPVSETTALKTAQSPYGNTKQIGEEILKDHCKSSPLKSIALRYFNPCGAHPSALLGEYPLQPPNNLVPVITQTAIGKRPNMTIFGGDYETTDGTCVRDFIHVIDIADAHVLAVKRLLAKEQNSNFEIFNLGTGNGNTVLEAIKAFESVNQVKLNYTIGPRREGDVVKVYASTTKAAKELNWRAKLGLNDIMRSAWLWEQTLKNKI